MRDGAFYGNVAWLSGIGHHASALCLNHVATVPSAAQQSLLTWRENAIGRSCIFATTQKSMRAWRSRRVHDSHQLAGIRTGDRQLRPEMCCAALPSTSSFRGPSACACVPWWGLFPACDVMQEHWALSISSASHISPEGNLSLFPMVNTVRIVGLRSSHNHYASLFFSYGVFTPILCLHTSEGTIINHGFIVSNSKLWVVACSVFFSLSLMLLWCKLQ